MSKQYLVTLTEDERAALGQRAATGRGPAREHTHARILLKADAGPNGPSWTNEQIAIATDVGLSTVARVRRRFVEHGLEAAIRRRPSRRAYQRKLDGEQEAYLVALAHTPPPVGRRRWTLRLLADTFVELRYIDGVSYEAVRQVLKKNRLKPWLTKRWCIPPEQSGEFVWRMEDALEQAAEAARAELAGGPLGRGALSAGMTRRLPPTLGAFCRPCGATHVFESLFRLVGVRGVWVLRRAGKQTVYERTDQWLGSTPAGDPATLRAALLRWYLRCFGPSTPKAFGEWAGIGAAEAQANWEQFSETLVETEVAGRRAWICADDLATFEQPPDARGVRFLPPYDAYLDQRDRATLIPNTARHRQVWAALGNPGALLVNGEIVGTWRPQKKGKRLTVAISAFGPTPRSTRAEIEAEAALLGPIRACTSVDVTFDA